MDKRSIYQRITDGDYKPKTPYSKDTRQAYRDENTVLMEKFKNDVFEDCGVTNNPKRQKCYDLAWELGHSSGLASVYDYFCEVVDLIKD